MKPGAPNLFGNDLMVENKELCNKIATRQVPYAEAVQQMISAEKYTEEAKITIEQLICKAAVSTTSMTRG